MSNRINQIVQSINQESGRVWDLCCDHGQIGIKAYQSNPNFNIHFVDQISSITANLASTVAAYIPRASFSIQTKNVLDLKFENNDTLIICGVGGILISKLLQNIAGQNLNQIELIICAHQDVHFLRKSVPDCFYLRCEKLIFERNKGYEILCINKDFHNSSVSEIGQQMWDLTNEKHLNYAKRFQEYYQLKCNFESNPTHELLLNSFNNLILSFNVPI